jgi:hypothetical protein
VRPTSRWLAAGACALALASCGGAAATTAPVTHPPRAATRPTTTTASSTTTSTTVASVTTTSAKPARATWHGDSTPAPALHNAGTDYVAIFLSLERTRVWLEAHHPDPALVPRVWVDGTDIAKQFRRHLGDLQRHHVRWVDVGDRSVAKVVSVVDGSVTLRVDEYTSAVHLVDDSGRVVDRVAQGPVFHWIVLLDRGGDGRWLIAAVDERLTDAEVHL